MFRVTIEENTEVSSSVREGSMERRSRTVLVQEVESLDVVAVIKAINSIGVGDD